MTAIASVTPFKKPVARLRKALIADLALALPDADPKTLEKAALRWMLRLGVVRYMEAHALIHPPILTGGWNGAGLTAMHAALGAIADAHGSDARLDEAEGRRELVDGLFALLAVRFPWVFDDREAPCAMRLSSEGLRAVVDACDAPELSQFFADDYALGWIFSFSTEGEREAMDAKVLAGKKIDGFETARKSQFFTDRYMVEWLVQNSLGLTWLCMCRKHGWTPDAAPVLAELDVRRADWRAKRDAGEVALDALMPVADGLEDAWKYYVPQALSEEAIAKAPDSVRALKVMDPAVGCGFFLFTLFDALVPLYREEARHRGETWTDREIAESIVENNLHGLDIDPECTRITAAMLWLKAMRLAPDAEIRRMNLADTSFAGELVAEGTDGPAHDALRTALSEAEGIDAEDLGELVALLRDQRHVGSLLKLDDVIAKARAKTEARRAGEREQRRQERAHATERRAAEKKARAEQQLGLALGGGR
jgi:hypothetical protein